MGSSEGKSSDSSPEDRVDKDQLTKLSSSSAVERDPDVKEPLAVGSEKPVKIRNKKFAILISYLGEGYGGFQRNPQVNSIEDVFLRALLAAGYIDEETFRDPRRVHFKAASRTDAGVSALRQVLSGKLPENIRVEAINEHLPAQVRALAVHRVTKSFHSKKYCNARTYSYTSPTFAFAPHGPLSEPGYRMDPETHRRVERVLQMYVGTHNFHNFTAKKGPFDASSRRYVLSFHCGRPFVEDDMELVTLKVKGQSFMLRQIRKMVGLTIAIARGLTTEDAVVRAWGRLRTDVPVAPGLGLLLEEVHYDQYNMRDPVHGPLAWPPASHLQVEDFRLRRFVPWLVHAEKTQQSMLSWLDTLTYHDFDKLIDVDVIYENKRMIREEKEHVLEAGTAESVADPAG